jgi:proline iminopeptidase
MTGAAMTIAALASHATEAPREGFSQSAHGRIWWKITGSGSRTPLLVLHGGPGAGHDYLEPLAALADQRPVIFYDQLGCGRSDKPDAPDLWNIDYFVSEIDLIRTELGLDRVILYGHSWGGWLAQEYLAQRGDRAKVDALVLASTSASTRQFVAGAQALLAAMPGDIDQRRRELEAARKMQTLEYQAIVDAFFDAHVYRGTQPAFTRSLENLSTSKTYPAMNGPNEFTVTGSLRSWDRENSLASITIPTLILTSELDEVSLDCHLTLNRGIRNSHLVVIPKARHLAMLEQPETYNWILRGFLSDKS